MIPVRLLNHQTKSAPELKLGRHSTRETALSLPLKPCHRGKFVLRSKRGF